MVVVAIVATFGLALALPAWLGPDEGPHLQYAGWIATHHRIPDPTIVHQAVLAYASDYGFLPTALLPHGLTMRDRRVQIASLDHTLWMHRPFRADEWLLYVSDSPSAHGARGFVRGQVFARDGQLIASVAQEGLNRVRDRAN